MISAPPPLRILMLAPQPFFEPRGTPFSEYHRIKVLLELGHSVDLVTYPFGQDVRLPGLRIIRCAQPPLVRTVPIGPSLLKVVLDLLLLARVRRLARHERYDVIHSHEEAGLIGIWLARTLGIPHLYDMHSSLPQQLTNFGYTRPRLLWRMFERAERKMVHGSQVVITICQELQEAVAQMGAGGRAILIENVMGGDVDGPLGEPLPATGSLRERWGVQPEEALILYTGTFEAYQGLDLLFAATSLLQKSRPLCDVIVVGGTPDQVEGARARARAMGARITFTGQRPAHEIPEFVAASDILVSPRVAGTNTPLKIYSYLRSMKPIVATDLPSHRQVLTSDTALLVPPDASRFAEALEQLIDHPEERRALARRAAAMAASRYSREVFVARTREAYDRLLSASGRLAPVSPAEAVAVGSGPADASSSGGATVGLFQ